MKGPGEFRRMPTDVCDEDRSSLVSCLRWYYSRVFLAIIALARRGLGDSETRSKQQALS